MDKKEWLRYFGNAWEMVIDMPLPKKVVHFPNEDTYDLNVLKMLPIAGLAAGLLILIIAKLLGLIHLAAAAVIFAVVMTLLTVIKDSGRSLGCMLSFIELKTEKVSTVAALYNMNSNLKTSQSAVGILTMIMVMVFYMLTYYLMMMYNFSYWMILVLVLNFTIQGTLATLPNVSDKVPLIEAPRHSMIQVWYIAGFISLFILFASPFATFYATVITFAVAYFGAQLLHQFCRQKVGGINTNIISFSGFIFEIVAFLIGIVFLVKP